VAVYATEQQSLEARGESDLVDRSGRRAFGTSTAAGFRNQRHLSANVVRAPAGFSAPRGRAPASRTQDDVPLVVKMRAVAGPLKGSA
jgi:hypothetical protein